jgi:radical SAM protein with 4Fe4S-binding SPASM domain
MNGINLLFERNVPLKLKTVVITLNRHEFIGIRRFAENLGLDFRFDAMMNERIDKRGEVARLRIPPSEVVELDLNDPRRASEYASLYERASKMTLDPEMLFSCGAGKNSFHIGAYGQLIACMMARDPSYDLRTGSFKEGWRSFLPRVRGQKVTKQNKCKDCGLTSICDQCPGWSQLEWGDQETPVEYLCQVAHLRAEAFGIEKQPLVK